MRGPFIVVLGAMAITAACGGATADEETDDPLAGLDAGDGRVDAGNTSVDSATADTAPPGECTVDTDCAPPETEPGSCSEGVCDPVLHRCSFRAKDADGDGQRAAVCRSSTSTKTVAVGDDCDDADPTTYPGAPEVCDGKDHTCGAPSSACTCVSGTKRPCYTGPTATRDVASCKGGEQTCTNGVWGTCAGEVLPVLAMTAPPDATHPCNGTNYWCDPAGVKPKHCPECVSTDGPASCGSDSSCNAGATRACTTTGTRASCLPAPVDTCNKNQSGYGCSTCSTFGFATSGSRSCSASCTFEGQRCVPNPGQARTFYPGNAMFNHECGGATSPGNPNSHWECTGTSRGAVIFGPYKTLPAGRYRVRFSFYGAPSSANVDLDVTRLGTSCASDTNGLCPRTVNPSGNGETKTYEYDFRITSDCLDGWETRIFKTSDGRSYFYDVALTYLGS